MNETIVEPERPRFKTLAEFRTWMKVWRDSLPAHVEWFYSCRSTGYGSARFGPCQVCGKPAVETWLQVEWRFVQDADGARHAEEERTLFGHLDCLVPLRKATASAEAPAQATLFDLTEVRRT
jgi:hypothetical protein